MARARECQSGTCKCRSGPGGAGGGRGVSGRPVRGRRCDGKRRRSEPSDYTFNFTALRTIVRERSRMHHAQNRTQNEQKSQYKKTDKVKELVVVLFSILRSRGCRDRMREVCVRCRVPVPVRALMQMRGAHARATLQ